MYTEPLKIGMAVSHSERPNSVQDRIGISDDLSHEGVAALIDRPLQLSEKVIAPNRLQLAPMTNRLSHAGGGISDNDIDWFRSRGEAGFGTIVTGGLSVSPEGQLHVDQPRADEDQFIDGLRRLALAREPGTVLLGQLLHGGLRVNYWEDRATTPVAPSAGPGVRELTDAEIEGLLDAYVAAAARTIAAGFDGVDVHAAHGYLPAQFLSSTENQRTDRWGGSFANRARFTLELITRMRAELPASSVIQLRLSAEDMRQSRGIDLDESAELSRLGVEAEADTISLSVWDIHKPAQKYSHTTPVEYVKSRLGDAAPLVIAGKIWSAEDAQLGFDQGADQLAIGRASVFNRDAPTILRTPGREPQRPPVPATALPGEGVPAPFISHLLDRWRPLFTADEEQPLSS